MISLLDAGRVSPIADLVAFCLDHHRGDGSRLMLNMVTSLDGATAVEGRAGPLSDEDDRALFMALRAACDVILVGAGTVRAEGYGPVQLDRAARTARLERGLPALPRLAVVSGRLAFDPAARLFSDPHQRPYILTAAGSPEDRRKLLADRAEVVTVGEETADPHHMVGFLAGEGHRIILCEGGPTLNADLFAARVVDEIDVAISPLVVGGTSQRLTSATPEAPIGFRLVRIMLGERTTFLRYLTEAPSHPRG